MAVDLLVKNARIVDSRSIYDSCIAIHKGVIVGIGTEENLPGGKKVVDAEGNYVIPGGIDVHVHFRDPGLTYKEDFATGSMAAAAGGITTIYDMPNVQPPTLNVENFRIKKKIAEEKSLVNYGIYAYLVNNLQDIEPLIEAGIGGFKWDLSTFDWELPEGYYLPDNNLALDIFRTIAKHDYVIAVHAEDMEIVDNLTENFRKSGRDTKDFYTHVEARPDIVEELAIHRSFALSELSGAHVHITHLTSKRSLELIKRRRSEGVRVTTDVGPAWFLFSADDYEKYGGAIRVIPAIKYKEDSKALWEGLRDGDIEVYATDHAPHSHEEKFERSWWDTMPGTIGVQTSMPLMLDKINRGELTLERYVEFAAEKPAQIYGIYPRKGKIAVGSDADIVILDMDKEWTITHEEMMSKTKYTPYNGWKIKGKPWMTIVMGSVVMEGGKIVGEPGVGKLVNPKQNW